MSTFGRQLKEAREARGVALDAVARATRIPARHLAALERGDLEGLPRGPFGKGYIKAFAGFLGIDSEPILEAYRAQERQRGLDPSESQRRTLEELSQFMQQRPLARDRRFVSTGWARGALALVAIGLLGAGAWLLIGGSVPDAGPATPPRPASRSTPHADPAPVVLPAQAAPEATARPPRAPERPVDDPAPRVDPPSAGLRVSHSGVGTGVEDHRLVGRGDRFAEGTVVAFWTRVLGGAPGDVIHHIWIHDGREVMRADLEVGGSHWRTFSRGVLPEGSTGSWVAEARDADGRLLAREEFLCLADER
jgi:transcriptional regulator with XRE-family HTH domain